MPTFPTADGLSRFDVIFGTAILGTHQNYSDTIVPHASHQRTNIPYPASEGAERTGCWQCLVALVDSFWRRTACHGRHTCGLTDDGRSNRALGSIATKHTADQRVLEYSITGSITPHRHTALFPPTPIVAATPYSFGNGAFVPRIRQCYRHHRTRTERQLFRNNCRASMDFCLFVICAPVPRCKSVSPG